MLEKNQGCGIIWNPGKEKVTWKGEWSNAADSQWILHKQLFTGLKNVEDLVKNRD